MTIYPPAAYMIAYNIRNSRMKKLNVSLYCLLFIFAGCSKSEWKSSGSIILKGIAPIGLAISNNQIWISDGDNNRVVVSDFDGAISKEYDDIDRPMHIEEYKGGVFVPSYMSDHVIEITGTLIDTIEVEEELEAPAAVSVSDDHMVIADFYNNRLVIKDNNSTRSIGKKGKGQLEFNYPTDVQVVGDKIYVADAYNNRIQVLNSNGEFLQFIGEDQGMNAATGLYVNDQNIFVTDFENDRILIFDISGNIEQIIDQGLNKPTDLLIHEGSLYVTNYNGKYISIFSYD